MGNRKILKHLKKVGIAALGFIFLVNPNPVNAVGTEAGKEIA